MAKEPIQLGEGFEAKKVPAGGSLQPIEVKPRHRVMGWGAIGAILAALLYYFIGIGEGPTIPRGMQERPGLTEAFSGRVSNLLDLPFHWFRLPRLGGQLLLEVIRDDRVLLKRGPFRNTIVNEGETALRDCFGGTGTPTCTDTQNFKFHGIGTSATAIAETDGGCITELTTQYNPDNTRATGSQTNNGANIYRTVGTNTVDAGATINEFCLMAAATGAANMWTRILTGAITLAASDGLQTTYDLTIE